MPETGENLISPIFRIYKNLFLPKHWGRLTKSSFKTAFCSTEPFLELQVHIQLKIVVDGIIPQVVEKAPRPVTYTEFGTINLQFCRC